MHIYGDENLHLTEMIEFLRERERERALPAVSCQQ